jgi:hypothetical protein
MLLQVTVSQQNHIYDLVNMILLWQVAKLSNSVHLVPWCITPLNPQKPSNPLNRKPRPVVISGI